MPPSSSMRTDMPTSSVRRRARILMARWRGYAPLSDPEAMERPCLDHVEIAPIFVEPRLKTSLLTTSAMRPEHQLTSVSGTGTAVFCRVVIDRPGAVDLAQCDRAVFAASYIFYKCSGNVVGTRRCTEASGDATMSSSPPDFLHFNTSIQTGYPKPGERT